MHVIGSLTFARRVAEGLAAAALVLAGAACGNRSDIGEGCDLVTGDLVISEIMPNPVGDDTGREWFEIYNVSSEARVLDRLIITRLSFSADGTGRINRHVVRGAAPLAARSYTVFGDGIVGVAPINYSYGAGGENLGALGNLSNDTPVAGISLICKGVEIDTALYGIVDGLPEPEEGRSLSFDGGVAPDAIQNDKGELWCTGGEAYDTVNLGSPGEANILCGFASCDDSGTMRDVVAPAAGDLVISEILGDPEGSDSGAEWVEIYIAASSAVDLNGIKIEHETAAGSSRTAQLTGVPCQTAQSGQYYLVASSADPSGDGSVTPDAVVADLNLFNSGGTLRLKRGNVVIDSAGIPDPNEGQSLEFDGGASPNAQSNDDANHWCFGSLPYDSSNFGTPGDPNTGCGLVSCQDGASTRSPAVPGVGDLIITELLPNPFGTDTGKEWVELFVAGSSAVDLNGLIFVKSSNIVQVADPFCLPAQPGQYVVVGASSDTATNGNVSVDAVASGLLMSSNDGTVEIWRGATLIDAATIPAAAEGVSTNLDPDQLTAAGNDDPANFCAGRTSGLFDDIGTPGVANDPCGSGCLDGVTLRPPVLPAVGELVISEVYANPTGTDNSRDWFEIYVAATGDVDLNGLLIENQAAGSPKSWAVSSLDCITVTPGSYAVIGGSNTASDNVTNTATIGTASDSLLLGSAARLTIFDGATIIDEINYSTPSSGTSHTLDPASLDATANDDFTNNWCLAPGTLGSFTDTGSPGLANATCP